MDRSHARRSKNPWYLALVLIGVLAACGAPGPNATAPRVTGTTPSSDGTLSTHDRITATFDKAIAPATLSTTTFILTGPGTTPVAGSVSYDAGTSTARFTPDVALAGGTQYTATLTTALTDLGGRHLAAPVTWTFTTDPIATVPDTLAPTVTATTPSSDGTVPTNAPITATFDEALDPTTLTTTSFDVATLGGTPVAGSVSYDPATSTLTFTPDLLLDVDTTYTATLTTDVTDLAGNPLAAPVAWTFTTDSTVRDVLAPTVTATTPLGSDTAPTSEPITATFDEEIDPTTLTTTTFAVTGPGTSTVAGSVAYDAATSTATFTPDLALAADTLYTATLTTGIADLAGNGLAAPVVWSFTTEAVVTTLEPVDLRTAGDFVLLSEAGVTTTTGTVVVGDLGVSPVAVTSVTGFDVIMDGSGTYATSAMVTGRIYAPEFAVPTPEKMTTAIGDMHTAYGDAAARTMPLASELGGGAIGGLVLDAGLYTWSSGVAIDSDLTLTGSATDVWILQIAQDLTLANDISVFLGGDALPENVFWQVAGKVTLGTDSAFQGVVLSKTAIVMNTNAAFTGRALAQTAITLQSNAVTQPAD